MNLMPTADDLAALPTLAEGQSDDLKVDTGDARLWLSRCSIEDGEPFDRTVYVELADDGGYLLVGHYDGDAPPRGLPGVTAGMFVGEVAA